MDYILSESDVEIRPMEYRDLSFFLETRNLVRHHLHDDREFTLEETKKWWKKTDIQYLIIEVRDTAVGYFRNQNLGNNKIMIGADIHPAYQRKGIAYISYKILLNKFISDNSEISIYLKVLRKNQKAFNLYKKLSFETVEVTEKDFLMKLNNQKFLFNK